MQRTIQLPSRPTILTGKAAASASRSLQGHGQAQAQGQAIKTGPPPKKGTRVTDTNYVDFGPIPADIARIPIRYLPTGEMNFDSRCAFCGPTKCGKTSALYWVLRAMEFIRGVCMCGSPEASSTFTGFVNAASILRKFDERFLRTLLVNQMRFLKRITDFIKALKIRLFAVLEETLEAERQVAYESLTRKAAEQQWSEEKFQRKLARLQAKLAEIREQSEVEVAEFCDQYKLKLCKEISLYLILDDLGSDGDLENPLIKHLMNNGRHYCIFPVITLQEPVQLPKPCRTGLDWIFVFDDAVSSNLSFIHENFAKLFPSFADFRWYVRRAKQMNGCIVLRKNHGQTDLDKCIFFMESGKIPPRPAPMRNALTQFADQLLFSESKLERVTADIGQEFVQGKNGKAGRKLATNAKNKTDDEKDYDRRMNEAYAFHDETVSRLMQRGTDDLGSMEAELDKCIAHDPAALAPSSTESEGTKTSTTTTTKPKPRRKTSKSVEEVDSISLSHATENAGSAMEPLQPQKGRKVKATVTEAETEQLKTAKQAVKASGKQGKMHVEQLKKLVKQAHKAQHV